jgi:peptide/nickel transport system substrate-binding protein/dipeptide transport system substrate-binding protein
VWSWNPRTRNEYNPARARQLLAKAGYPDGFTINLWALPVQRPTNPNGKLMAQMIQQDWAKIGVKPPFRVMSGASICAAGQGEHDVYMSGVTSDSGIRMTFCRPRCLAQSARRAALLQCEI